MSRVDFNPKALRVKPKARRDGEAPVVHRPVAKSVGRFQARCYDEHGRKKRAA